MSTGSDKPASLLEHVQVVVPLTTAPTKSGKAGLKGRPPPSDGPHGTVARKFNWIAEARDDTKT